MVAILTMEAYKPYCHLLLPQLILLSQARPHHLLPYQKYAQLFWSCQLGTYTPPISLKARQLLLQSWEEQSLHTERPHQSLPQFTCTNIVFRYDAGILWSPVFSLRRTYTDT